MRHTLTHDASGRVTNYDRANSDEDRYLGWNARHLPTTVTVGDSLADTTPKARDEFLYGPDGQRYYKKSTWEVEGAGDADSTYPVEHTYYAGAHREVVRVGDTVNASIATSAVSATVLHVRTTPVTGLPTTAFEYLHRDHLGSVESVTDAGGQELKIQAYDPFGSRRESDWTRAMTATERTVLAGEAPQRTARGYTGHEHLERTGLIHMNGRVYDPAIGWFLSPDPIVADASFSQSWNAYSYALNSPLSYSDPSGLRLVGGCPPSLCSGGGFGGGGGFGPSSVPATSGHATVGVGVIWSYGFGYGLPSASMRSRMIYFQDPSADGDTATVTARDADGDTAMLSFAWTVSPTDLMPDYSSASVAQPSWARNQAIVGFTVPAASGGNTPLRYSASGLPAGIAMSTARAVSGTPTGVGTGTATVTVTDADGDTATFTFNWAVVADDLTPSFGSATIASQSWVTGKEITAFAATAASGGNAPLVHGIAGLPAGVVMLNSMQIQGTLTAAGSGTATVAARDADGDLAKVSFNWTVTADAQPSFGTSTVSSQSWTAGQVITALTVPSATGGNGTLSYGAAGLPDGVALSPTLELSGRPLATGSGTATVTARDIDGDTATLTFDWTVASPNPANTGAVLSVIPDATAIDTYTVQGMYSGTREYVWWTLYEQSSHGLSEVYSVSLGSFMQRFVNRTNGTYTYRLEGCYFAPHPRYPDEDAEVCENVGAALPVTVNGPNTDSVGTQLADTYEARVGRMSTNGPKGLYIKRTSTAVGAGLFQDVILKRTGNAFELVAAPPGSTNATTGASWSVTTAVDLVLNDINLDGFVDILVRGVAGAIGVTGAVDQIVYAPGHTGGPLGTLRAVDSSLTNFLSEVSSWTQDPTYFQRHQQPGEVTVTVYRPDCFNAESRRFCSSIPTVVIEVSGARPTNKSSEAREFADQFTVASGKINSDVALGSSQARNLSGILERVLGVGFFNGNLEQTCTGSIAYDADSDLPCDRPTLIGRILMGLIDTIIPPAYAQNSSTVQTQLPEPTPGIVGYGQVDGQSYRIGQYGTSRTIQSIVELGRRWKEKYPDGPPLYVGDISLQGGGPMPDHTTGHRIGKNVDIRPVRNDGGVGGLTYDDDVYDFEKTQELVNEILKDPNVRRIWFNDDEIEGPEDIMRIDAGNVHDNHLHVEYYE